MNTTQDILDAMLQGRNNAQAILDAMRGGKEGTEAIEDLHDKRTQRATTDSYITQDKETRS